MKAGQLMCGGRGEKRGVRTRGKERCDKVVKRRKEAAEEGSKKHGPPPHPIGMKDLKLRQLRQLLSGAARCCQLPT